MPQERAEERPARPAGRLRPAHPRPRQRPPHGRHRHVVQLEVLRPRPLPIVDVRLVPHLPVPAPHGVRPVPLDAVRHPPVHQFGPLAEILRRPRLPPLGRQRHVPRRVVRVVLRVGRHRLGREPDLHVRPRPGLHIGVEDAIRDRPVVHRSAGAVLGVGVGAGPLQARHAVAAAQQVVATDVHRGVRRAEPTQLADQFLPVGHVGVVRLVVAEEPPDRLQVSARVGGVDGDRDRHVGRAGRQREQADQKGDERAGWHGRPVYGRGSDEASRVARPVGGQLDRDLGRAGVARFAGAGRPGSVALPPSPLTICASVRHGFSLEQLHDRASSNAEGDRRG